MGKDRENTFHPGKGKPSGANKEEGLGLRKTFDPDDLEQDEKMTERYTKGEDELSDDLRVRHPNRNTSKGQNVSGPENNDKSRQEYLAEDVTKTAPEELLGNITKETFSFLAEHRAPVCVSILLPSHKPGVEVNEQVDVISFKNALQETEKILAEKSVETSAVKNMLEPGYDLLRNDKFWYDQTEGLAVYISEGNFKYLRLKGDVPREVRVNSSFYVSPLIPFMVKKEFFYLLDLAKKQPRFYRVDALGIEHIPVEEMPTGVDDVVHFEEKEGDNLFRTGGRGGTGGANFHGIGGGKPDEKQHIAIYFEEVDDTLWKTHLHNANVPLLLSGIDYLLPIYRSVSDYKHIWPEAMTGNHKFQSDTELYEEAMKIMQPYFDRSLNRYLEDYGNKSATGLTSSAASEIIPAAHYGRIAQLFVKKGFQVWGSFDEMENKLSIASADSTDAEDLVDKAVVKTIQTGGEVFLLEPEQMPQDSKLAAIFRY